jgi:multidrug efflux pump subunit AcrA (membrane-fusion protein)
VSTVSAITARVKSKVAAAKRGFADLEVPRAVRVPRRAVVLLAIGVAVVVGVSLSVGGLQSAPAASEGTGAGVEATRGDVVVTVGGVGRIVQSGLSTDIAVPSAAGSAAASGAAASGGTSAPTATSATAVFPQTSGRLLRFLVAPGQHVAAGQPLALLDDRGSAGAAIAQARNDVASARVELRQKRTSDPLKGLPATSAELAAARGAVRSARLRLERLVRGPRPADVGAARLDLRRAEAELETLLGGTSDARADAIALAQQSVDLAQQKLDTIRAAPNAADVATAQAEVRKAESDLALLLRPGSGALPAEVTAARAAVDAARLRLERLLAPPNAADVTAAQLDLERAKADLRRLQAGPSPAALAAARQAVEAARGKLAQLLAPPLRSDVAAARFDVLKAEADLAVLRARGGPASRIDIALARLRVAGAQLRLANARVAKPMLTVRAPSPGTVTALLTIRGAPVDPVTPIASVADLDRLAVNVDLSEFDVARVRPGLRAVVSVDALGGKAFPGRVLFAALTGANTGGVVTFPVRVGLAHASGLRPGMNVSVRIIVAKRIDVVQVPVEAVSRDEEDRAIVTVIDANGEASPRTVTLGLSSNKNVEVVKGLRAGERVVLPESQGQGQEEGD